MSHSTYARHTLTTNNVDPHIFHKQMMNKCCWCRMGCPHLGYWSFLLALGLYSMLCIFYSLNPERHIVTGMTANHLSTNREKKKYRILFLGMPKTCSDLTTFTLLLPTGGEILEENQNWIILFIYPVIRFLI